MNDYTLDRSANQPNLVSGANAPAFRGRDGSFEEGCIPARTGGAVRSIATRRSPLTKRPKFIQVEHRFLRPTTLGPAHALALGALRYRGRRDEPITTSLLAHWFGWSRSKAWRVMGQLVDEDLLGRDGSAGPAFDDFEGPAGVLKVNLELVHLGDLEAVALTQLQSWGSLRMVHVSRGFAEVRQGALGRFLGCCSKTVGALLERLSTGLTVGVARSRRMGRKVEARAWVALDKGIGRATYMRLLSERQAQRQPKPPTLPQAAQSERYVPSMDELNGMIGAGRTGPTSPA